MELRIVSPAEQPEALRRLISQTELKFPEQDAESVHWTGLASDNELIACAGVEVHGADGLLRSVAVSPQFQGKGYGSMLIQTAILVARIQKLSTLYLFTDHASGFFVKHGFQKTGRETLPTRIAQSKQAVADCGTHADILYGPVPATPPVFLVLCTGNSCRSQMAHAYLEHFLAGTGQVYSAGIETHGLNPGAVSILQEDGLDITHHTSNHVNEYRDVHFDLILTVCDHAKEHCPWIPGNALRIHHNFSDPSKVQGTSAEIHSAFLQTREEVKTYCRNLISALGIRR
jgi:arsenate reductase